MTTNEINQHSEFPARQTRIERKTNETKVTVVLNLDGTGRYQNQTGIGFLDHMLDLFSKHSGFDLEVTCEGDLHVDEHHTIEDVAISLGQALRQAIGDKQFIARYGFAYVPMDETLARAVVDLSGRFYLHFDVHFSRERVGDFPTELVRHFWWAFAEHAQCNLHIDVLHGENAHHQIEAVFKSCARALNTAVSRSHAHGRVLSTKGII